MIVRINLHPDRKIKVKANPFQRGAILVLILIIAELAIFVFAYMQVTDRFDAARRNEATLNTEKTDLESRISEVPKLEAAIAELLLREMTLAKLASLRIGPQFVLNEISRILSNPKDAVTRKAAVDNEWTLSWEPDSVMLRTFKDIGEGRIQIDGQARTMDDISEFWKRLKTSPLFRNVRLVEIKDSVDSSVNLPTQAFVFTLDANFNYQTKDGQALVEMLTNADTNEAIPSNDGTSPETGKD